GTVFQIHITGFTPDEKISFWLTLPDGEVAGTPMPLDIGHHGAELDDIFDSSILEDIGQDVTGIWAITYQGEKSGNQSIAWFRILPQEATPTPTPGSSGPPPTVGACDTNGMKDATVSPGSGPKGTTFNVTVRGFKPGESASYWLTDPDGAVFGSQN